MKGAACFTLDPPNAVPDPMAGATGPEMGARGTVQHAMGASSLVPLLPCMT